MRLLASRQLLLFGSSGLGALLVVGLFGINTCFPERDIHDQMIIAARTGNLEKVKELVEKGADLKAREKVVGEGHTALFNAASAGHTDVVKFLIEKGAEVNKQPGKVTSLMMAAWAGKTDTVRVLLQAGADPNAKDEKGWTALADVARKGYIEIARLLIEKDADVNVRLTDGNTPLSWASATKNQEMMELLKRAGATE
jgi:ankyrin repeat protein